MRKGAAFGALVVGLGVLALYGARQSAQEEARRDTEAQQAAAQRDARAKADAALAGRYAAHRDELLASMRAELRGGHADQAAATGLPYLPFADAEFTRAFSDAKRIVDAHAAQREAAAAAATRTRAAAAARKLALQRRREGVEIGMTKQQVLASSWGRPQHVNQTITSSGTREQWIYGDGAGYLYFDGNLLTGIQTGH